MLKILRSGLAAGILGLLTGAGWADPPPPVASDGPAAAGDPAQCGMADCCADPAWSIAAGAVFLARSSPNPQQIIHPTGSATTVSNGSDFDFDDATGPEITIDRRFAGDSAEARYFGALDWASAFNYGAVGNVQLGSFANFGATGLRAEDDTRFQSAEINWLHPVTDRITLLAGGRWLGLDDELRYHVNFPAFSADYDWSEVNRLYGGQLGGKVALWDLDGPLSINAVFKAGVFADSAENNFNLHPSTGGAFPGGAAGTATSFVGEIDIAASYAVTRHIALSGGYQLLWIDRLALAADQAAAATANGTQNAITVTGDLFTYGATADIDFTW